MNHGTDDLEPVAVLAKEEKEGREGKGPEVNRLASFFMTHMSGFFREGCVIAAL